MHQVWHIAIYHLNFFHYQILNVNAKFPSFKAQIRFRYHVEMSDDPANAMEKTITQEQEHSNRQTPRNDILIKSDDATNNDNILSCPMAIMVVKEDEWAPSNDPVMLVKEGGYNGKGGGQIVIN